MSATQLGLLGEDKVLPSPRDSAKAVLALEETPPDDPRFRVILDAETFNAFFQELQTKDVVSYDTETSGLDWERVSVCGLCFGWDDVGYYIPTRHTDGNNLGAEIWRKPLSQWFLDAGKRGVELIMHNAKFDVHMTENEFGLKLFDLGFVIHDTMMQAHLLRSDGPKALKMIAERLEPGANRWDKAVDAYRTRHKLGKGDGYDVIPVSVLGPYAAADTVWTSMLHAKQLPEVLSTFPNLYPMEIKFIDVLQRLERVGVWCDVDYFRSIDPVILERMKESEARIIEHAGVPFDVNSNKSLGHVLFNRLGLPISKFTPRGNAALDVEALEPLRDVHPIIPYVLEHRLDAKKHGTYVLSALRNADKNSRIHTSINPAGAGTGRMSSSEPNLQNVLKDDEIRRGYGPDRNNDYIWALIDYSQIEVRIFAYYSGDPTLLKAFRENKDIYSAIAAEVYGCEIGQVTKAMRGKAKVLVLGIQYGMGVGALAKNLGMEQDEARAFLDHYYERFPGVQALRQQAYNAIRYRGYVRNAFERRSYLENDKAFRAVNYLCQGCAADLLRAAILRCDKILAGHESRFILPVHDELIFEIKRGEEGIIQELAAAMADFPQFEIPIKVDVSIAETSWADEHETAQV